MSRGALQASIPANADELARAPDLAASAAEMGASLGTPGEMESGSCAFGRYGAADLRSDRFEYVRIWVLVSAKPAVAVFTWISNEMDADEADAIVMGVRPANEIPEFYRSVVLDSVHDNFQEHGHNVPAATLYGNGLLKMLPIWIQSEAELPTFADVVRTEVRTSKSELVAIVVGATVRGEDGTDQEVVTVYIETATARQAYILPIQDKSGRREMASPSR